MNDIALEFGLTSPVTRELTGNLFYVELAREVVGILVVFL